MSCKCIEEATKKIREITGDPEAIIDTAVAFNINSTVSNQEVVEWIKMTYTYRPKKRNGEFGRPEKGSLVPTFCPICGEQYKKGDAE